MKLPDQRVLREKLYRLSYGFLLIGALALSGCASTGDGVTSVPSVGPQLSSDFSIPGNESASGGLPKVDVVVPVFDPNIPEDSDTWAKKGIYPELRRAESNRFALKMKTALEDTNSFRTVRVVPNSTVTGDLYVIGKIIQSNGEDVKINIAALDITGRKWLDKDFKHRVKGAFHDNIRNKGKDPYAPVFDKAAAYIIEKLKKRKPEELEKLRVVSELRFGSSLSEETFARYLKASGQRVDVAAAPADNDPMLKRIKPIRVRHQLFIDQMQTHYADFDAKLNDSYLVWQKESLSEAKAARKAKRKSITQGILGGLLVVAGAVGAANADSGAEEIASIGALAGGAAVLGSSFENRAEMKVHREALAELGKSIDIEVAPQVVEYENQTAQLTGDAAEQYAQWIDFLKKIYELEATPEQTL